MRGNAIFAIAIFAIDITTVRIRRMIVEIIYITTCSALVFAKGRRPNRRGREKRRGRDMGRVGDKVRGSGGGAVRHGWMAFIRHGLRLDEPPVLGLGVGLIVE